MAARLLRAIPADVGLLLAILAVLAPLRVVHTARLRWMATDGGWYTEIARNVRDGLGLVGNVSLHHAGHDVFPHAVGAHPLWPLVLGHVAKVVPLEQAAHWLPLALYFVSLALAFVVGRRLWPAPLLPTLFPAFHAGHLFVLLLGLQRHYVSFSSLPYTEPLAWTLLLLFFVRLLGKDGDLSPRWAAEIGAWASLVYFARAPMIVVPAAVLLALAGRVALGPDRGRAAVFGLVGAVFTLGPIAAWYAYLRTFVRDATLSSLWRLDRHRASDVLTPLDGDAPSLGERVRDALSDLPRAWDLVGDAGYQASFFGAHWALPLALPFAVVALVGWLRREGVGGALGALRGPRAFAWAVLGLVAVGGFSAVHLAQEPDGRARYFDDRPSIASVLLFFAALAWLLGRPGRLPRALGVFVLATTVGLGARHVLAEATKTGGELRGADRHAQIVRWLGDHAADEPLVVAMPAGTPQRIGWRTRNVGYHTFTEDTSYADLLRMTDALGARYVLYDEPATRTWRFREEGAGQLEQDFEALPDRPDDLAIVKRRASPPPPLPKQRVVVVGVDGASWKVMAPMIERGELPTFRKLLLEGASQLDFDTLDRTASPLVWTSVATGQPPEVHGVEDYTQVLEGQGKVPITSDARKVPALWNLVSDGGLRVTAINWWASWPSEPVNGVVVSDHANPAAAGWMAGRYYTADLDTLAALQKDTWPPELAATLAPYWMDPNAFPLEEFDRRGQFTDAQMELVAAAPFNERNTYAWLKTFFALDRPHFEIARDRLRADASDLTMVYLRGPDPVQHWAWDTVEPYRYEERPANLARDRGVVQGVYRFVDTFLAEIVAEIGEDTTLIVLSDHGAEPHPKLKHDDSVWPGGHTRAAKGVLFVYGPHARAGAKIERAGPLDVAPTVMWALGLPVADDLPGRVLAEAFTEDFRARRGRVRVPTWGTRTVDLGATASPADDTMMEQLRGLGYIE